MSSADVKRAYPALGWVDIDAYDRAKAQGGGLLSIREKKAEASWRL